MPPVLVDAESPLSFRAFEDHIEVKLVLLLPVDHPIILNFDNVLDFSQERGNSHSKASKPLSMDSGALIFFFFFLEICSIFF